MADLKINFGFTGNAQSLTNEQRKITASTDRFARLIMHDVMIRKVQVGQLNAEKQLKTSLERAVMAEVDALAMTVGRALSITENVRGPRGQMTVRGGWSQMARNRWGNASYFQRASTGITWDKRDPKYVDRKSNQGKSRNWWDRDGDLAKYLSKRDTYTQSFGPVRVYFTKARNQERAFGRLGSNPRETAAVVGRSPGGARNTLTFDVGTVRVVALGKITPDDLPSLRTENPADAKPGSNSGLADYLRDPVQAAKLKQGAHMTGNRRFVLEPFLSFYLTRAIPNAVWHRIEQMPLTQANA